MMAATVNTNASAGESLGGPHAPPPRRTSSPTWDQILRGPEVEGMVDPHLPPAHSPVNQRFPDGYEVEDLPDGGGDGNDSVKPAWNKPYDAAVESGVVMGAVSWPTLSESTNGSPKTSSLADSSTNPHDAPISVPQIAAAIANDESSPLASPRKQMTSKPSKPNPNATQQYGVARQKSMRREGGGSSSTDGGFSQSSSMGDISHTSNSSLKTSSGGSGSSGRDHGYNNAAREGVQRSGGDRPQQRNYRRSNSGPHLRGDSSFGGRRDQDRRNHDWNHQRSFNGRDSVMPPQRVSPSGFIRPPPPGATAYIPPPPMPYGGLMGIPPEMQPLYYVAPYPGMPFVAQMPPPVYYPPQDSQLHVKIINQIDYYFSNDNLIKDTYLRKNMDEHGWVPIQLIANFKKVMQLATDIQLILDAVRASTVVEVQGDKIRKRDDWMRWIMPSSAQFPTASSSRYPRMLQETLPAHVQGLSLDENMARLQL